MSSKKKLDPPIVVPRKVYLRKRYITKKGKIVPEAVVHVRK